MKNKIDVAVLGATGSVGQKFVELLSDHPWFRIAELTASERSSGKKYFDAVNWIMQNPLDSDIGNLIVKDTTPNLESKLVFSALDSSVAGDIETEFANKGYTVISNARNHRFDEDVPLIIPEVNPEHLEILNHQKTTGKIITNPNCSTIGMVMALKPLHDLFGIESVNVVTLQAISGSGYPGLPSLDILENVLPYISGEEIKMETEPLKILSTLKKGSFIQPDIKISAQCNRVPVIDGHTECIQVKFKKKPAIKDITNAWNNFVPEPQILGLPSAPSLPIHYFENPKYPQPKLHRNLGNGMSVSVGRLRECSLFDYKFVVLSHNTVRGAAGGTILIAELLKAKNFLSDN